MKSILSLIVIVLLSGCPGKPSTEHDLSAGTWTLKKKEMPSADTTDKFFPADSLGHLALAEVGTFWADDKPQVREDKSVANFQRDAASLGGLRLRGKNKSITVAVFRMQQDAIRAMEELREDVASVIIPGGKHSLFPGLWWYTSGIPNAVFVNHENTIVRVSCYQPKYDKSKDVLIRTAAEVVDRISKESKENVSNQQMRSTPR